MPNLIVIAVRINAILHRMFICTLPLKLSKQKKVIAVVAYISEICQEILLQLPYYLQKGGIR